MVYAQLHYVAWEFGEETGVNFHWDMNIPISSLTVFVSMGSIGKDICFLSLSDINTSPCN